MDLLACGVENARVEGSVREPCGASDPETVFGELEAFESGSSKEIQGKGRVCLQKRRWSRYINGMEEWTYLDSYQVY